MAHSRRRNLPFAVMVLLFVWLAGASWFHAPSTARAQNGDANASFDAISPVAPPNPADTANPPRLYAGDLSHVLPAAADLDTGTNGYCVTLHTGGLVPFVGAGVPASSLGFSLLGVDPIDPTNPATPPSGTAVAIPGTLRTTGPLAGAMTGVAGPAVLPTVNGDKYCVVAQAPVGYETLRVSWTYLDTSSVQHTIILNDPTFIPVVTVTLRGSAVGNAGQVCTVAWDASFLTGRTSNLSGTLPDPLNIVQLGDWILTVAGLETSSVQPDATDSSQWCISFTVTAGAPATATVSFRFDAVYNRLTNTDDAQHEVALSPALDVPGTMVIAHIGANGEILTQAVSPLMVIGAPATICILGSGAGDTLNPSNIQFSPISGPPDIATVSSVTVFTAPGAAVPPPAVAAGTLCFTYTSSTPGEHAISLDFSDNGVPRHVSGATGALIVQWNRIDSTRIAGSAAADAESITFTTITVPLQFNVADGTFIGSIPSLVELVTGSHLLNGTRVSGLLQGALFQARIEGDCGYFVVPNPAPFLLGPTAITGKSVGGRFELDNFGDIDGAPDDLRIDVLHDTACNPGSTLRVLVDTFYPGQAIPAVPVEYVDINFSFIPPSKVARVAWIGQVIPITYAFSSNVSCAGQIVHFVRPKNQHGAFVGGPGVTLQGAGSAVGDFGAGCSLTVNYTSADPGEVDIEAFIETNPVSKIAFPIYFIALEDLTLSATATSVVSTLGDVSATARGYFVGSNPSGRPAETKADGRRLPVDRWILPDDAGNFNGSLDLPPLVFTFLMENEAVVNSFKTGVKNGGLGWFIPDGDTIAPEVGRVPDSQGVVPKPRQFTVTASSGSASVSTFGDLNLSYEGCAANAPTGSPHCKVADVVGHTTYFAVADYAEAPGKYPPIISNTATTEWTWAGYKSVTVLPGESAQYKYVVAHLMDRDGYCDAAAFNNTLGVAVQFQIDSGEGVILEAQGQPSSISVNRRIAVATTFDTVDDFGRAINADITKATVADGECQAWIKISNSLLEPANVVVTFPPQPAPLPGTLRLTTLSCAAESVTVTNTGSTTVSLAGFAIRSLPASLLAQEEHLGLSGLLQPGQSATFAGGPASADAGWIRTGGLVFSSAGDYARLVWNGFEVNRLYCDGLSSTPLLPSPLPPDGEGQIILDVIIPFGLERELALQPGWMLLGASANPTELASAFGGHENDVGGVYGWNESSGTWSRFVPAGPEVLNTMTRIEAGQAYWIDVKRPFTLTVMK